MGFYFSHSYRDVVVNSYFLGHLVQEQAMLVADQKSETWCVAKLERYLFESAGFISIIPKRATEQDPASYSQYIGHELDLARRARVPRLLFVEHDVLQRHATRFPQDALAFNAAAPEKGADGHRAAIRRFLSNATASAHPLLELRCRDEAVVYADEGSLFGDVAHEIVILLRREGFSAIVERPDRRSPVIDNVRLLEDLWRAELCVFVFGSRVRDTQLALAVAQSHSIPAMRLQHNPKAKVCVTQLNGTVVWSDPAEMLIEFRKQLDSFRRGFVEPVGMALNSSSTEAARILGTTQWRPTQDQIWNVTNGPALVDHVPTNDPKVRSEVVRAQKAVRQANPAAGGREREFAVCEALYDGLKRLNLAYEIEAQVGTPLGYQKIRSPNLMWQSSAATCIDLVCLFAAMIEGAGLVPLLIVVRAPGMVHALVGYRASDEPAWRKPTLGELRRAVQSTDAVVFEATGAVASDASVAAEEPSERADDKMLDFAAARDAAQRLLAGPDVELVHLVDVRAVRG